MPRASSSDNCGIWTHEVCTSIWVHPFRPLGQTVIASAKRAEAKLYISWGFRIKCPQMSFISVSGLVFLRRKRHPTLFPCHRGLLFGYLYLVWGPPDASSSSWDDPTRSALTYLNWRKKSLPKEVGKRMCHLWFNKTLYITMHKTNEAQGETCRIRGRLDLARRSRMARPHMGDKGVRGVQKGNRKGRALRDPLLADLLNPRLPDQTDNGIARLTHEKGNTNVHSCICWLHTVAKHPWPSKCKDATLTSMHVRTWRSRGPSFPFQPSSCQTNTKLGHRYKQRESDFWRMKNQRW